MLTIMKVNLIRVEPEEKGAYLRVQLSFCVFAWTPSGAPAEQGMDLLSALPKLFG